MRQWRFCLLLSCGLLILPVATASSATSETGRTRVKPTHHASYGKWFFSAGAGVLTSGDLFKVVQPEGIPLEWIAPGGNRFHSHKYIVTLDEDLQMGLSMGYRIHPHWHLRLDLSWAEVNATAEASIAETVELYLYDKLTFLMSGLALECVLLNEPSYPFLLAAAVRVDVNAANTLEIEQDLLGWRIGVGYQHALDQRWSLRAEIRDTIGQLELDGHSPKTTGKDTGWVYEELGPQHLFEITGAIKGIF